MQVKVADSENSYGSPKYELQALKEEQDEIELLVGT